MVRQRKADPAPGSPRPNHQEDAVTVRLPFRLAAAAGLFVSALGVAQEPPLADTPVAQVNGALPGAPGMLQAPAPVVAGGPAVGMAIDPVPLNGPGGMAARVDLNPPVMPPYAWPTYSPYNNYSRVAYPNEYPYSAFPYIGPMYPFPKVPLGYRAIKLEWEDGHWWYGRTATKRDWWMVRYW
jgi:hypothetical protein